MSDLGAHTIVIGGGMIGSAIAFGLSELGQDVMLYDEGDSAHRAARGNFGLLWLQLKGKNSPAYASWSRQSASLYQRFTSLLQERSGVDVQFSQKGALFLCLSDNELAERAAIAQKMVRESGIDNEIAILDRSDLRSIIPVIGDAVCGATMSPHEGHVNPLRLLRAMHAAFEANGGRFSLPGRIIAIAKEPQGYVLRSETETYHAKRIVLAAGLGNAQLGPMIGTNTPVRPVRGQVLVTEKIAPFLKLPTFLVRQAEEGGVMIGDSQEEVGFDDGTTYAAQREIASRAVRYFPRLSEAKIVRTWGALRVMPKDGIPIYQESQTHAGAFIATAHSGVTLAAVHALKLAPMIAGGHLEDDLKPFSSQRFDNALY